MASALAIDALLVLGFGVQHSILATLGVKARLARFGITPLLWRGLQSFLNVAYIFVAIALWQSTDDTVWHLSGVLAALVIAIGAFGWLAYFYLHLFEYDVGLAFGSSASACAMADQRTPKMELWKVGSRRWIRFPVHTAFFPMFFAFPTMSTSTLVFAITANAYNIVGTILYDKRLEKLGSIYTNYQKVTGNILPRFRSLRGAADLEFPSPQHWRHPLEYTAAAVVGVLGGVLFWVLLGRGSQDPADLLAAAGVGLLLAIFGGGLLGLLPASRFTIGKAASFTSTQTRLATAIAIVSALSLVVWCILATFVKGAPPYLPLILPLWLIVLWCGHLMAAMVGERRAARSSRLRPRSDTRPA